MPKQPWVYTRPEITDAAAPERVTIHEQVQRIGSAGSANSQVQFESADPLGNMSECARIGSNRTEPNRKICIFYTKKTIF